MRRVLPMAAEFAAPMWVFGQRPFHVLQSGRILAVFSDPSKAGGQLQWLVIWARGGPGIAAPALRCCRAACVTRSVAPSLPAAGSTLALIDPASSAVTDLDTPFTSYSGPTLAVHEASRRRPRCRCLHRCCCHCARGGSCSNPLTVWMAPLHTHRVPPQTSAGGVHVAMVAGSALQPLAVVLLEAASEAALAASKPGDWVVVEASAAAPVSAQLALPVLEGLWAEHVWFAAAQRRVPLPWPSPPASSASPFCCYRQVDAGYLSEPQAVEFATAGGLTAHMNYYPPRNKVGEANGS